MKIKKGDTVKIITGTDKGKTGKVTRAIPKENKVVVADLNKRKVHRKSRRQGEKGQIIEVAMPVDVSNVVKSK
ncbi:MAG: 50S ribosomal protein L24 [Candidatus Pacebacteria bacterium]|nr:50S ribosomal protein L24 [Candidatus Paceibacterota bacterium]